MTGMKSLAEFASADAKNSNYFSGGVYVEKILLGRQCVRRTRAVGRNPFGRKVVRLFASYLTISVRPSISGGQARPITSRMVGAISARRPGRSWLPAPHRIKGTGLVV